MIAFTTAIAPPQPVDRCGRHVISGENWGWSWAILLRKAYATAPYQSLWRSHRHRDRVQRRSITMKQAVIEDSTP